MRLREFIVERITVIKFGVNDRGSDENDTTLISMLNSTGVLIGSLA